MCTTAQNSLAARRKSDSAADMKTGTALVGLLIGTTLWLAWQESTTPYSLIETATGQATAYFNFELCETARDTKTPPGAYHCEPAN